MLRFTWLTPSRHCPSRATNSLRKTTMTNAAAAHADLIRRAYVNLKSVRDNLPEHGYIVEKTLFAMFNRALAELQAAGKNVSEWRMPPDAAGRIDTSEFRAKIDAILMYFTVQQRVQIGFLK